MAPFLAEPVSRTCSIALVGVLGVVALAKTIPSRSPTVGPAPLRLDPIGCQKLSQPASRHIYVAVDDHTLFHKTPELDERARTVALLTVAEHADVEIHLADDDVDDDVIPGQLLTVRVLQAAPRPIVLTGPAVDEGSRTLSCSVQVTLASYPEDDGKALISESARAEVTYDPPALATAKSACVTVAVEDAVDRVLRATH